MALREFENLMSVSAIQQKSEEILQLALENGTHFNLQMSKLELIADYTIQCINQNYPNKKTIPLHSRWRHFDKVLNNWHHLFQNMTPIVKAKSMIDLAVISVLLDAGTGNQWRYQRSGKTFTRSEGLAIATFDMFKSGVFSSDPNQLYQVDGTGLLNLNIEILSQALQLNAANVLEGLRGRWQLLQNFGQLLLSNNSLFPNARFCDFIEFLHSEFGRNLKAVELIELILLMLNKIWPDPKDETIRGDIWEHPQIGWIPFHKLTLWLGFSLIEPLQTAQFNILHLEELPGLAEYRNGGLFLDGQALKLKDPDLQKIIYQPSDVIIIEWRALTLALLERLADIIRKKLGVSKKADLPLVNILQGGTWQAGRQLAFKRSSFGEPPLKYCISGTVF